jgi:hypothetical protein
MKKSRKMRSKAMKYQKPELVSMGSAITTIQASLTKSGEDLDNGEIFSPPVYRSDE